MGRQWTDEEIDERLRLFNPGIKRDGPYSGGKNKCDFICDLGHRFSAIAGPIIRKEKPCGCPYCSGKRALPGFNDFATHFPELLEEWDFEKNDVAPTEITKKSGIKIHWICKKCGKKWPAPAYGRAAGSGCPKCSEGRGTSFPEQALFYYTRNAFGDKVGSRETVLAGKKRYEVDVLIRELSIAIEHDGLYWHEKKLSKDEAKRKSLADSGYKVIRVCEGSFNRIGKDLIEYDSFSCVIDNLEWAIAKTLELIGLSNVDINLTRDRNEILSLYKRVEYERSLEFLEPQVAAEWHFEKNAPLTPDNVSAHSGLKVWWICQYGHETEAYICNRTGKSRTGCYECGRNITARKNSTPAKGESLLEKNPEIAEQWCYEKNGDLSPDQVYPHYMKKVWWTCELGHDYPATPDKRVGLGSGCPFCAGKKVLSGFNDLETTSPEIASQWDHSKNDKEPSQVTEGSGYRAWWICDSCGHNWDVRVDNRKRHPRCPECKSLPGGSDSSQMRIPI